MQGPRPTPTHLKVIRGNPGCRKLPKHEPKPKVSVPSAPAHLTKAAKSEWKRVTRSLKALGIISTIDRAALAAYCQAYGRWVQAENALAEMAKQNTSTGALIVKTQSGNVIQNPLVGVANKAMRDLMHYAVEFGMTPSARVRVRAEKDGDQDPSERYFD